MTRTMTSARTRNRRHPRPRGNRRTRTPDLARNRRSSTHVFRCDERRGAPRGTAYTPRPKRTRTPAANPGRRQVTAAPRTRRRRRRNGYARTTEPAFMSARAADKPSPFTRANYAPDDRVERGRDAGDDAPTNTSTRPKRQRDEPGRRRQNRVTGTPNTDEQRGRRSAKPAPGDSTQGREQERLRPPDQLDYGPRRGVRERTKCNTQPCDRTPTSAIGAGDNLAVRTATTTRGSWNLQTRSSTANDVLRPGASTHVIDTPPVTAATPRRATRRPYSRTRRRRVAQPDEQHVGNVGTATGTRTTSSRTGLRCTIARTPKHVPPGRSRPRSARPASRGRETHPSSLSSSLFCSLTPSLPFCLPTAFAAG